MQECGKERLPEQINNVALNRGVPQHYRTASVTELYENVTSNLHSTGCQLEEFCDTQPSRHSEGVQSDKVTRSVLSHAFHDEQRLQDFIHCATDVSSQKLKSIDAKHSLKFQKLLKALHVMLTFVFTCTSLYLINNQKSQIYLRSMTKG